MLNRQLKNIQRIKLTQSTQDEHLKQIRQETEKQKVKQKRTFTAALLVFATLLFIFAQTLSTNRPILKEQSATIFELGDLSKVTHLYNKRVDRQLDLTSPFYFNKMTITDRTVLNEIQKLLQDEEMKPYNGDLTRFSFSNDYLFEQKNGQSVYLKFIYENNNRFVINPKTMMAINLNETKWNEINKQSLEMQLEVTDFPMWKIIGIAFVIILKFLLSLKRKNEEAPLRKNSIFINVACVCIWFFFSYSVNNWLGAGHFLLLIGISNFCLVLQEFLYVLFKYDQQNWQKFLERAIFLNILFFLLLI